MIRLPNQQEFGQYNEYFRGLCNNGNKVPANVASGFLMKSKLPKNVLAKIWDLSDRNRDGFLGKGEFFLAMHLIKVYRESQIIPSSLTYDILSEFGLASQVLSPSGSHSSLSSLPSPLPGFGSMPNLYTSSNSTINQQQIASPIPQQSTFEPAPQIPLLDQCNCGDMSIDGKIVCREIFEKFESVKVNKKLSGQEAKVFLKRFPIPSSELKLIWNLSDRDCDGFLTLAEFTLAIFLIQYKQINNSIPPVIAQDIFDKAYFTAEDERALEALKIRKHQEYSQKVFAHIQKFMNEVLSLITPVRSTFQTIEVDENNMRAQRDAIVGQLKQEAQVYTELQKSIASDTNQIAKLKASLNTIAGEWRNIESQMRAIQNQVSSGNTYVESHKNATMFFNKRKSEYEDFKAKSEMAKVKIQEMSSEITCKNTELEIIMNQATAVEQDYMNLQNEIRISQEKAYNEEMAKQAIALEERRQQMQMQLYQQQQLQAELLRQRQQQEMEQLRLHQQQEEEMDARLALEEGHQSYQESFYDSVSNLHAPFEQQSSQGSTSSNKFKSIRCRTSSIYKPQKRPGVPSTTAAPTPVKTIDFGVIADPFNEANTYDAPVGFENFTDFSASSNQEFGNDGDQSNQFQDTSQQFGEFGADSGAIDESFITYEQPFLGVMLYDYTPEDVTQTPLQKDRLVMIFYKTDNYYYTGSLDATIFTYFPEDYVSLDTLSEDHQRAMCEYMGSFTYAYAPLEGFQGVENEDLSFELGDLLFLTPSDDSWFYGYCNGKMGIAPSNFVQNVSLVDLEMYAIKTTAPCGFTATHEYEIDVAEGDIIYQHYQSTKGYVFGYSENTKKVGWFTFSA